MPGLHIRDLPEDVIAALKRRAAANHRSLQKELVHILLEVAQEAPARAPLKLNVVHVGTLSNWSREEIYDDDGR